MDINITCRVKFKYDFVDKVLFVLKDTLIFKGKN